MRQKTLKIYWTRTTKRLISCYAVKHACVTESLRVFAVYFFLSTCWSPTFNDPDYKVFKSTRVNRVRPGATAACWKYNHSSLWTSFSLLCILRSNKTQNWEKKKIPSLWENERKHTVRPTATQGTHLVETQHHHIITIIDLCAVIVLKGEGEGSDRGRGWRCSMPHDVLRPDIKAENRPMWTTVNLKTTPKSATDQTRAETGITRGTSCLWTHPFHLPWAQIKAPYPDQANALSLSLKHTQILFQQSIIQLKRSTWYAPLHWSIRNQTLLFCLILWLSHSNLGLMRNQKKI